MTILNEIYKCEICGNIVEVIHTGKGTLVCCNQDMKLQKENTKEKEGKEKHIPVIEETKTGILIKIGSIEHPMEKEHYIEFIEVLTKDKILRKNLKSGEKPQAEFNIKKNEIIKIREYCNKHSLWTI
jgi:superoxide reductase